MIAMTDFSHAVVPEAQAIDEAYKMGFQRFEGAAEPDDLSVALSNFKESAEWANVVAPSLRALAGYADPAGGTYTDERKTVVVPDGYEDDLPREGELVVSAIVHERLVDAFDMGAYDAFMDVDYGHSIDEVQLTNH